MGPLKFDLKAISARVWHSRGVLRGGGDEGQTDLCLHLLPRILWTMPPIISKYERKKFKKREMGEKRAIAK